MSRGDVLSSRRILQSSVLAMLAAGAALLQPSPAWAQQVLRVQVTDLSTESPLENVVLRSRAGVESLPSRPDGKTRLTLTPGMLVEVVPDRPGDHKWTMIDPPDGRVRLPAVAEPGHYVQIVLAERGKSDLLANQLFVRALLIKTERELGRRLDRQAASRSLGERGNVAVADETQRREVREAIARNTGIPAEEIARLIAAMLEANDPLLAKLAPRYSGREQEALTQQAAEVTSKTATVVETLNRLAREWRLRGDESRAAEYEKRALEYRLAGQ